MTIWSHHYHFAHDSAKPERERRGIWFATNDDDDQARSPGETPQLPDQEEQLSATPQGIEGISGAVRGKLERVRPLIARAASNSPYILEQLLHKLKDPALEAQIRAHLKHVEQDGGTPPSPPEIQQRIEEYLEDPRAAAIVTQAFEDQLQQYRNRERELRTVDTSALQQLEVRLNLEGRRSLKENEWTLKELREMARYIRLSPRREWSPDDLRQMGKDAQVEHDSLLEVLHNKLEAARSVTVLGQHDLGKEVDVHTLPSAIKAMEKQLHHARKHLDLLIEAQAKKLNEAYEKKLLPWFEQFAKDPDRVHAQLGVSGAALKHAVIETGVPIKQALRLVGGEGASNLPKVTEEGFTQDAIRLLRQLQRCEQVLSARNSEELEAHLVGREQFNQKEARAWAACNALRVRRAAQRLRLDTALREQLDQMQPAAERDIAGAMENCAALCERLKSGQTEFEDEEQLYDEFSQTAIARREALLTVIENPSLQAQFLQETQEDIVDMGNAPAEEQRLLEDLSGAEQELFPNGQLHPALDHEVCRSLNVEALLRHRIEELRNRLNGAGGMKGPKAAQYLRSCAADVRRLLSCAGKLDELDRGTNIVKTNPEEYRQIAGTAESAGFYSHIDHKIYINTGKVKTEKGQEAVAHHERGHAIVDLLMRRTGALPGLLVGTRALLQQEVPSEGDGQTYEDLLMQLSQQWFVEQQRAAFEEEERRKIDPNDPQRETIARDRADARIRELLTDELLNRHASWVHEGRPEDKLSPAEKLLYEMLDQTLQPSHATGQSQWTAPAAGLHMTDVDDTQSGGEDTATDPEITDDPTQHLIEIRRNLNRVRQFLEARTELSSQEGYRAWQEWLANREGLTNENENKLNERTGDEQEQARTRAMIKRIRDDTKENADKIGAMEKAEHDVSDAPATGRGGLLRSMFENVQWVCIYDLYNMVKDAGEDIHRLWKRRGERARSTVGHALTSWIPEWVDSPLYLGKLKHEFKRRSDQSEIEEVKQWKDALENRDAYELREMLHTTHNKDELRAIIELLVDRGRLDWNDKGFWNTLNELSHYHMPPDACMDNDILRDQWLQKLITDIWGDKDHFTSWRRTNDGNVESKKKEWTSKVDQLANISGGMSSRLEHLLRAFVEAKEKGKAVPDVNPHFYEEIIHYAMRNGKMSMEDKFFYLVQGVRWGLLSIDRLRVLAGEGGHILMIFPYIDYFYQKNNSYGEVCALADRLLEGTGRDRFKPGLKTTMFVRTEVAKEQAVKERLRKAISKKGEEIDHDDIPYFMTDIDWSGVDEWLGVMSGTRQKLSKPALMNIYPGFNMKFKTAAVLAAYHKQKKIRLSKGDVAELVQRLIAYIYADNILSKNGVTGANRPAISETEYDQRPVVSGKGRTARQYRESMTDFGRQVFSEFAEGQQWWQSLNLNVDQYVGNRVEGNDPQTSKRCAEATSTIAYELQRSVTKDQASTERFIDILAAYGNKFLADGFTSVRGETIAQYTDKLGASPRMAPTMVANGA